MLQFYVLITWWAERVLKFAILCICVDCNTVEGRSLVVPKNFISINDFRKSTGPHKMDSLKKRTPDYTDIAHREAVARLRYLLAESYSPHSSPAKGSQVNV